MASTEAVSFYGPSAHRFLSPHQAAVLDAATHRLVPGPHNVIGYLDCPDEYINGIAVLDQQAGGDFTSVSPLRQDLILAQRQLASFTSLLFGSVIDAMYAVPRHVNRCDDSPRGIAMA